MVQAHTLRQLLSSDGSGKGQHRQDLCQVCQKLGGDCRDADEDDAESVVSTISTVSDASNLTPTGSDNERSRSGSDTEDELVVDLLSLKLTKK